MKVLKLKGVGKDLVLVNYKHAAIWEDVTGGDLTSDRLGFDTRLSPIALDAS